MVGFDVLAATAKSFYEIYRLCEQRKANDASVTLLKERIETLVKNVEEISESSDVETAFQSTQELVRRLQAAISSARMIIERYAEANTVKRIAFSGGLKEGLTNVSNELNGCTADLNLLMTLRNFNKLETPEARTVRERRLAAELESIQKKFNAALEQDAKNHEALAQQLEELSISNQKNKTDLHRQAQELSDGIHDHLHIMDKGIHKTLKAMNITNAKSISKEHVNNYSLIHSGRHIVEHCEYSDGDFSVPCVFKYVNTGMNRYIGHQQVYDIGTEVAALTALGMHPYFPKLFGKFERDPNSVGILMEYVGENGQQPLSLREYLTNNIVEWSERLRFMRQIVSAVAYMHKSGIVHCGLNSGDILIRNDPEFGSYIKLMDFDRAIIVAADTANPISDVHSRILEHPYFAPEIHNGGFPSYTTDIFAVGTLLWELAYCTIPFDHVHPEAVAGLICSGERDGLPSGSHNGAPPELVKVIKKCWSQDPYARPNAQELDDATFDIYRCDVAAFGQADNPPTTLKEWREEYLSLRGGLSCEDLYCVRVLSGFWFDRKLPSTYLPSDPSARKSQAMKWLQHAADRYGNGGAAYELGKEIFGGMNNPDGRQWLTKAKEYGHPPSIKLVTYHQYKVEKVLSKKEYEVVGAKMLYLCTVRDALAEQRRQQREGLF